jgi:hypothetical protein
MTTVRVTSEEFLQDRQGRTFTDVLSDTQQPFADVLTFFNSPERQRRMEEAEIHHDRAPLAGVVRELEAQSAVDAFLSGIHPRRSLRLRQAIGVLVRIIMERRGWRKTGRKGSLGVRATRGERTPRHNTGGLAFWFIRAERYELTTGMPFSSVKQRRGRLKTSTSEPEARNNPRPRRDGARPRSKKTK